MNDTELSPAQRVMAKYWAEQKAEQEAKDALAAKQRLEDAAEQLLQGHIAGTTKIMATFNTEVMADTTYKIEEVGAPSPVLEASRSVDISTMPYSKVGEKVKNMCRELKTDVLLEAAAKSVMTIEGMEYIMTITLRTSTRRG